MTLIGWKLKFEDESWSSKETVDLSRRNCFSGVLLTNIQIFRTGGFKTEINSWVYESHSHYENLEVSSSIFFVNRTMKVVFYRSRSLLFSAAYKTPRLMIAFCHSGKKLSATVAFTRRVGSTLSGLFFFFYPCSQFFLLYTKSKPIPKPILQGPMLFIPID